MLHSMHGSPDNGAILTQRTPDVGHNSHIGRNHGVVDRGFIVGSMAPRGAAPCYRGWLRVVWRLFREIFSEQSYFLLSFYK